MIPKPKCRLTGEDGNAFAIIGRVSQALKRSGQKEKAKEFQERAMKDDYDHLLAVALEYVEDVGEDDFDEEE